MRWMLCLLLLAWPVMAKPTLTSTLPTEPQLLPGGSMGVMLRGTELDKLSEPQVVGADPFKAVPDVKVRLEAAGMAGRSRRMELEAAANAPLGKYVVRFGGLSVAFKVVSKLPPGTAAQSQRGSFHEPKLGFWFGYPPEFTQPHPDAAHSYWQFTEPGQTDVVAFVNADTSVSPNSRDTLMERLRNDCASQKQQILDLRKASQGVELLFRDKQSLVHNFFLLSSEGVLAIGLRYPERERATWEPTWRWMLKSLVPGPRWARVLSLLDFRLVGAGDLTRRI